MNRVENQGSQSPSTQRPAQSHPNRCQWVDLPFHRCHRNPPLTEENLPTRAPCRSNLRSRKTLGVAPRLAGRCQFAAGIRAFGLAARPDCRPGGLLAQRPGASPVSVRASAAQAFCALGRGKRPDIGHRPVAAAARPATGPVRVLRFRHHDHHSSARASAGGAACPSKILRLAVRANSDPALQRRL